MTDHPIREGKTKRHGVKPAPFNDGGLIYPRQVVVGPDGTIRGHSNPGMTLLQHYAGLAMMGMFTDSKCDLSNAAIAGIAFAQAQAMIEAEAKLREGNDG